MNFHFPNNQSLILACTGACFLMNHAILAQEVAPPPLPMINANGPADQLQPVQESDIEADVLTRGPVHEAYAEQYVSDPEAGLIVGKQPPEVINELPPEEMPEGDNVEWIPGYWAWEEDSEDYIWVSGLWRDIPIGQQWIPGYWTQVDTGWQWVPGFWTSSETEELSYLPEPPQSLEQGPNIAAPTEEHFWIPGCWVYQSNNYAWRPGYWERPYNDYLWVPARYQWTPRGYVYCAGYWDYPLFRRGVLFSPVRFVNRRYPRRFYGYRYRPRLVVSTGPLLIHLFVRPRYRHYYFGDYYSPRYRNRGIYPFVRQNEFARRRYAYDPIRSYYQLASRRNTYNRLVDWHRYFDRHESVRPPRTVNRTRQIVTNNFANRNVTVIRQATLSESITDLTRAGRADRKTFTRIPEDVRQRISDRSFSSVKKLTEQRISFETRDRNRGSDRARDAIDLANKGQLKDIKVPDRDRFKGKTDSLKLTDISTIRDRLNERRDGRSPNGGQLNRGNDSRDRSDRQGDARSNLDSLRERMENARNQADGDRGKSRDGKPSQSIRDRSDSSSDLRDRIEQARKSANERRDTGKPVDTQQAGKRPTTTDRSASDLKARIEAARNRASSSGNNTDRTNRNQNSSSDLRARIEAARKAADANRNNSNRSSSNNSSNRSTNRGSSSSSSDLRARIEAARKAAESKGSSSNRSNNNSNRSSTRGNSSSSSSDLKARIEAARKAAESRSRSQDTRQNSSNRSSNNNRTVTPRSSNSRSSSSSIDLRSRIDAARRAAESQRSAAPKSSSSSTRSRSSSNSSSRSSSPSTKSSSSRSSIQDAINRARSSSNRSSSTRSSSSSRSSSPSRSSSTRSSSSSNRSSARSGGSSSRSRGSSSSRSSRSKKK